MLPARRLGWIFALIATILYSTNTPIARSAILAGMEPTTLAAGQFAVGALMFGLTLGFSSAARRKPGQAELDWKHFYICILSGVLNGFTLAFFYNALVTMSASLTNVLSVALFPIVTLILLALRGEKFTRWKITRLAIALFGLFLLLGLSGRPSSIGIIYIVMAATVYGLHLVSVQWYLKQFNSWLTSGIMMGASAVVVIVYWLFSGADTFVPGWLGWAAILYQGIVLTFIGRAMIYESINRIGSGQFAMLAPLETLLTILWSVLFLSEGLLPIQWIGAVFILISAAMAAEFGARQQPVAAAKFSK